MTCPTGGSSFRLVLDWDMVLQRYDPEHCGPGIYPEELPLSPQTVAALWHWYRAYSDLAHGSEPGDEIDDADWRLLEGEGLRLWPLVQEELGQSCRVFYCSVLFHQTFATPEEYEHAVGDERFR